VESINAVFKHTDEILFRASAISIALLVIESQLWLARLGRDGHTLDSLVVHLTSLLVVVAEAHTLRFLETVGGAEVGGVDSGSCAHIEACDHASLGDDLLASKSRWNCRICDHLGWRAGWFGGGCSRGCRAASFAGSFGRTRSCA